MNYKLESYPNHTKKYMPSYLQENILSQKIAHSKDFLIQLAFKDWDTHVLYF